MQNRVLALRPLPAVLFLLAFAGFAPAQTPVILISIDTLRADHLGVYGYRKIDTPNIDSLAEGGTVFESVDSQIPLTLPSHTVLFTSTYPFENRIEENDQHVPAGTVTLASVLRSHGYKTAAFVGSVLMDQRQGLDQGFDLYDSPFRGVPEELRNPFAVGIRRDGALVYRAARQWLEENRDQPVFVFLHLFDLHAPYAQAPSPKGLPNTAGYDIEIAYVDRLLGQFREALAHGGWWDRALVVLLSDHGESLGDHGESSHGYFVYQSTLRVPLIFHWPAGAAGYAGHTGQPAGLIDVAPTILDFLKVPPPPSFEGKSLFPAVRTNRDDGRAVYSESLYPHDAFRWASLRAVRLGAFQYIDSPKPELYDLATDPDETHNRIAENSGIVETLRARLSSLLAQRKAAAPAADDSPHELRALESLGYLGHGWSGTESGADPKDRLGEYDLYEQALASMYSGNARAAILDFRRLLSEDSHNSLARYYLGDAYLRAGQPASAVREWTNALRLEPDYVPAAEALGAWWIGREEYSKARAAFQQALAAAPGDYAALYGEGLAEERLGLLPDALKHLQKACRIAPDSASCKRELDTVQKKIR